MQVSTIATATLEYAQQKDREDKLSSFRSRFYFPSPPAATANPYISAATPSACSPATPPTTFSRNCRTGKTSPSMATGRPATPG
ncbi:hypothetical protein ACQ86N_35395 [Puia sp. P3]|uniref:hypothetical protein n=1 Tax=Puia sp. P3 TaxID=3423952 RepID=UPI003D66CD85